MKGETSPTWLRKYREEDEEEAVTKRAIKKLEIFVSIKYFTTFSIYFFFFQLFLRYHFFPYFFNPRHSPTPTPTTSIHYPRPIACVASVFVRFRSKERGTRVKDRAKNGTNKLALISFLARPKPVFLCSETKWKRLLRRLTTHDI